MIIASGYIELNELKDIELVSDILQQRKIEVVDINHDKIIYLIERDTQTLVRKEIESLRDIEGIRNVYLTYFSLEGADEG